MVRPTQTLWHPSCLVANEQNLCDAILEKQNLMSYILNIATAVPEFSIEKEDMLQFYSKALASGDTSRFAQKLNFLINKTKINKRYTCISDYKGGEYELFTNGHYQPRIEKRMELYEKKILPLAAKAIDKLLIQSEVALKDITHLITVSCTGLLAPGIEFLIAERYGLQHTEKIALNFLGCYAALKALKQAHYIAGSNPDSCILIVSAELCSLHFYPSDANEDIVSNLLFSDGAAAVIVCGNENKYGANKVVLQIDTIGSGFIPNSAELMSWKITSSAFRMFLSSEVVEAIKQHIHPAISKFLEDAEKDIDYWAIHPGGVKIIEAVQESLNLNDNNVADSLRIMQQYGNMSSPTILFILSRIFNKIIETEDQESKNIFSCAFGPGLNIEMIRLSSVTSGTPKKAPGRSTNTNNRKILKCL